MFTGLIQAVGLVETRQPAGGDLRIVIATGGLPMHDVHLGESIARESPANSKPLVADGSVVTSPASTGASSLSKVNGAVRDAQNALKVPKLPSVGGLPANIPLEVGK